MIASPAPELAAFALAEEVRTARVRKSRRSYILIALLAGLFSVLLLMIEAPVLQTVLALTVGTVASLCLWRLSPVNYTITDRALTCTTLFAFVIISWTQPHLGTAVLFAPLFLQILYSEHHVGWRRGMLFGTQAGFVSAILLVGSTTHPTKTGISYETIVEIHCVIAGATVALLTGLNRELNLRTHLSVVAQSSRIASQNASIEADNVALAAQRESLRGVQTAIRDSITSERELQHRLNTAHEQLRQFALAASHDLREPIRTIRSFTQLAERALPPQLGEDPVLRQDLSFVSTGCTHMQRMLDKLLDYQRTGQDVPAAEDIDVVRLWRTCLRTSLTERITEREARPEDIGPTVAQLQALAQVPAEELIVARGAGGERLPVQGLTVRMPSAFAKTLFTELLRNALTYHDGARAPTVGLVLQHSPDGRHALEVHDNGIGVPAEYRQQVFSMFKRLHPREVYPGSGLGLSLAVRICTAMGTEISFVEPVSGVGARVRIVVSNTLPSDCLSQHTL